MQEFGFIGLGVMGSAMAKNLVKAGFKVTVWNRSPEKSAELAAVGARVAANPAEVTATCGITFAMLADPAAAEAVCFGPDGALAGIGDGRGYVDMSTVDGETSAKIGAAILQKGGKFLEAPVSGSKKPAEDGTLVILAAGDRSLYDAAMPGLEKMGKKILFLGAVGNGARMKLVVNMVMGGMMTIFCEGLALAEKGGLEKSDLLEVLDAGALANPMFKLKGGLISQGNYTVAFPLKHMQKDLRLAVALGDTVGQPLVAAAVANEAFKKAKALGCSDEDFSAVYKVIS
ncbi:NAD(P)-dependent oxidoreductase [Geomesophilobacter sediminis]|uniref:NAD(P)-dependent oxidoreductase n=1 Tax=Geomesophilobacter sediminis TaxID=2798584 RepID=A0A8J7M1I2_9BACT|nr:NAD(P)-dependent oxidoreductase [Geomesophilobacter sediminis]MBJ6726975.1 NAD(P)-dependent oxidoreductase [Geomesophilobacter sediminis]